MNVWVEKCSYHIYVKRKIKAKEKKNRGKVYNKIGWKEVSINVVDFKVQNDRISQIIDFFY